jgi:hypothetical protein
MSDPSAPTGSPEAILGRRLTPQERIEARHLLQVLSEDAKSVRNAMDPIHGIHTIRVAQWEDQWRSITNQLNYFTVRLASGTEVASDVSLLLLRQT